MKKKEILVLLVLVFIFTTTSKSQQWMLSGNSGTDPNFDYLGTLDNNDLVFRTNNLEKMRLDKNGFLGLGVITPSFLLDINGDINFSTGSFLRIGGVRMLSNLGVENIFLGENSGLNNSSGSRNSFFGSSAGLSNTTGFYNTFIGTSAGRFNINGSDNVFVGKWSGGKNTGSYNTYLGSNSGYNGTSGIFNTFIGYSSGLSNATGTNNTFIGSGSDGSPNLNNATAIGSGSFVSQDNSLILGKNAFVGIGNSAPQYSFHNTGAERTEWYSLIGDINGQEDARLTVNSTSPTSFIIPNGNGTFSIVPKQFSIAGKFFLRGSSDDLGHTIGVDVLNQIFKVKRSNVLSIGVRSQVSGDCGNSGFAVFGNAFNSTLNVGVVGIAGSGNENNCEEVVNIGVYGEANDTDPGASNFNYAQFSNGSIHTTGSIFTASDSKFKTNIKEYDSNMKAKFLKLRPVSYDYKSKEFPKIMFDKNLGFGFIAQEVEEVFPNLVKNNLFPKLDSVSSEPIFYKSVNYVSLIPVLTYVLQDEVRKNEILREEIAKLKETIKTSTTTSERTSLNSLDFGLSNSLLYQNEPNPFKDITLIKYNVPNNSQKSSILIFNMNGLLLKTISINNLGEGSVQINGGEFKPGMYIYSLLVDGREVDSKRMILLD